MGINGIGTAGYPMTGYTARKGCRIRGCGIHGNGGGKDRTG